MLQILSFFYNKLKTVRSLSILTLSILLAACPKTLPDKREEPLSDLFILFVPSLEIEPPVVSPLIYEPYFSSMLIEFLLSLRPPFF